MTEMGLPDEMVRAEILDWWEQERDKIARTLPDRLPALFYKVDERLEAMSLSDHVKRKDYVAREIEPVIVEWITQLYNELAQEADDSFRASVSAIEGVEWSNQDMAAAGIALAVSAAPAASLPFLIGGLTTAGVTILGTTFGGGALIPAAVAAAGGGLLAAGLGFPVRSKATSMITSALRTKVHEEITARVVGSDLKPDIVSLKQTLFQQLQAVAEKRLEMAQ